VTSRSAAIAIAQRVAGMYRRQRLRFVDPWKRAQASGLGAVGARVRVLGGVSFGSEPYLVFLGNDVTISDSVQFFTHDGGVGIFRGEHPGLELMAPITVGNSVFIGSHAIILPGVRIGDRVVIGAASIVARDVPSGVVAAGVPCRTVRSIEEYEARALAEGVFIAAKPGTVARKLEILEKVLGRTARSG
jgi:carbonic anhydrase/acetyltransferase-like protein (isoleucine patch superfamily)